MPDADVLPEDPHPLPPPTATFAGDAERHLLDAPRHCPRCGATIPGPGGLVVEWWAAEDRGFEGSDEQVKAGFLLARNAVGPYVV